MIELHDIPTEELLDYEDIHLLEYLYYTTTVKRKGKEAIAYLELTASYDNETSSFRDVNNVATSITYSHALNVKDVCFLGRHWSDFLHMMSELKRIFKLSRERRLVIYVHNLSYEFQFLKGHLRFTEMFFNGNERKILYALAADYGIEFRCSYMLANAPLAVVAKNLTEHTIDKLDGEEFDYKKIRTPDTLLTEEELHYILNDALIVNYYIDEVLAQQERPSITRIPMTATGFVRNYTREHTIKENKYDPKDILKRKKRYRDHIATLTMEKDEYYALKAAFAGGYTHANAKSSGKLKYDVTAFDFTSSYPARMVAYKYPMSKGFKIVPQSKKEFHEHINEYCCLFFIQFDGIMSTAVDDYISFSKTDDIKNYVLNNGRVHSATRLSMWMTEVDFAIITQCYEIDDYHVADMWCYKKDYLPTTLIEAVLKLYSDKTRFKGVADQIVNYNMAKAMLNSIFGMCVQDVVKEDFEWDGNDEAHATPLADELVNEKLDAYNKSKKRFLFYPWGVWITAYGRYDLFTDIIKVGKDYHYGDTDSIYVYNTKRVQAIIDASNARIRKQLDDAITHHGIDPALVSPKDPQGVSHTIGLWSVDGFYTRFKTLGAKRYMVEKNGKVDITVSGVNKKKAVPHLIEEYGENVFEAFSEDLRIPEKFTGKPKPIYFDKSDAPRIGIVTDYLGGEYAYHETTGLCLEESDYTMSISPEYNEFLQRFKHGKTHIA